MRLSVWNGKLAGARLMLLGSLAAWFGTRSLVAQLLAPNALTIKYIETHFRSSDGAALRSNIRLLAMRSNGSRVEPRTVTADDGKLYSQRVILDVERRKRIVVEGVTESVITTALSDAEVEALSKPGGVCLGPEAKQGPAILGYPTLEREIRTPVFVVREWRAPDLGCVMLRQSFSLPQPDGTARLVLESAAVELTPGEPDPTLFEIPDWPERLPSQALERYRLQFGLPDTEELRKVKEAKDRAYWARQR
jgi:hypothetical protein